jgi:hypothetical protein
MHFCGWYGIRVPTESQFATDGSSRLAAADSLLTGDHLYAATDAPLSAVPITSQQDPVRHALTLRLWCLQESSSESTIDLKSATPTKPLCCCAKNSAVSRSANDAVEADEDPEEHLAIPGDEFNADNTVPVAPLMEDQPRQGLWVDIEI